MQIRAEASASYCVGQSGVGQAHGRHDQWLPFLALAAFLYSAEDHDGAEETGKEESPRRTTTLWIGTPIVSAAVRRVDGPHQLLVRTSGT